MDDIEGVLLDPMALVQIVPFAGNRLEGRRLARGDLEALQPFLDGRIPPLSKTALGVCGSVPGFGETDRGIRSERKQFLLAIELVAQAPSLAAGSGDVDVEASAVGELVGPVRSLGFPDLDVSQHELTRDTRSARTDTQFHTRSRPGLDGSS